jgi:hypothetical protein
MCPPLLKRLIGFGPYDVSRNGAASGVRAEFLAAGDSLGRALAIDGALDVEQDIDPLHGLKRDRIDHSAALTTALLASRVEISIEI